MAKDKKEGFYHGILLGLLSSEEDWLIQSNPEAGDGYCDIRIEMDDTTGCIIEVKYAENRVYDEACAEALAQIDRMNYVEELTAGGLSCVYKYAVACYKKGCQVVCEKVKQ